MSRIRIILSICSTLLSLQFTTSYCGESIDEQIESNHVTFDKSVTSRDRAWKLSMQADPDGTFLLLLAHGEATKTIDRSSKPDFRICWSDDGNYMVSVRPVGFTTMVKVYSLDKTRGDAREIFASEKVNQRKFVDYGLQRWDLKHGFVVFNVYENARYLERREPRLLATDYIYLDGQNGY